MHEMRIWNSRKKKHIAEKPPKEMGVLYTPTENSVDILYGQPFEKEFLEALLPKDLKPAEIPSIGESMDRALIADWQSQINVMQAIAIDFESNGLSAWAIKTMIRQYQLNIEQFKAGIPLTPLPVQVDPQDAIDELRAELRAERNG
jgi:hypothetical protein